MSARTLSVKNIIKSFFPRTINVIEHVCETYSGELIPQSILKAIVIETVCEKDTGFKQFEIIEKWLGALDDTGFELFKAAPVLNSKDALGFNQRVASFFVNVHAVINELQLAYFQTCKENNTLTDCNNQEPDYDTVGFDPATVVPADPEVSKAVDDALDLQEVTIRIEKETFQRLEAKAKEQGIITKALIRKILADNVLGI